MVQKMRNSYPSSLFWFWVILILSLTWMDRSSTTLSYEVRHENNKLPSAVIVGTVYCDSCLQESFSKTSHFISGADVQLECPDGDSNQGFREEVKTNENGEFRVPLPSSMSKHLKKIKGCFVKWIRSSDPSCSVVAASPFTSSMHLKSNNEGEYIFSAGVFSFKPMQQSITLCNNQKLMSLNSSKKLNPMKKRLLPVPHYAFTFPPPFQNPIPTFPNLPPLPRLPELPPLPQLPPLPHLPIFPGPQFPFPPFHGKSQQSMTTEEDDILLHPNLLQSHPQIPSPSSAIGNKE